MNSLARNGTMPTTGAIRIEDVVKVYDPDGAAVMVVDHCLIDIPAGEICMIVGPSGCGKTTLLNTIAGFHGLTSGHIYLDGEVLCGPGKEKAEPGSDRIVVFQNGALFPWKTNLENIAFVTFLGAFYTIVINVLGGAKSINKQYLQAAQSMGASQKDIFRRIVLPATLPSIVVGSAVGMGITWEVVVAAEMISGGGSGGAGGGLGFFIWSSYVGGSYEQIYCGYD